MFMFHVFFKVKQARERPLAFIAFILRSWHSFVYFHLNRSSHITSEQIHLKLLTGSEYDIFVRLQSSRKSGGISIVKYFNKGRRRSQG